MEQNGVMGFRQAVSSLGAAAAGMFDDISRSDMAAACEVRLRAGAPPMLSLRSGIRECPGHLITREELEEMVFCLCGSSVYTHQQEMAEGFIPLPGGHRAGVCGRAVRERDRVVAVSEITSIVIRIARDITGCAGSLLEIVYSDGLPGLIVAGAPGSGKTTLLRDLACSLALGTAGRRYRVAVVDERGELACAERLERCCDVLRGYPKAEGVLHAVRCLAPEVIVCDELGSDEETEAVCAGMNAGAAMLCSIHAGGLRELTARPQATRLLATGAFEYVATLSGRNEPGSVTCVIRTEEIYEAAGRADADRVRGAGRYGVA